MLFAVATGVVKVFLPEMLITSGCGVFVETVIGLTTISASAVFVQGV